MTDQNVCQQIGLTNEFGSCKSLIRRPFGKAGHEQNDKVHSEIEVALIRQAYCGFDKGSGQIGSFGDQRLKFVGLSQVNRCDPQRLS